MRKLVLLIALLLTLSITTYGQTKPAKPAPLPAPAPTQPVSTDIPVADEDVVQIEEAYRQVNDKKKDYDLSVEIATRVEADAAANAKASRKTHYLVRNEEGKLVFRLRPPAPTK